jgi:hypothetical protein
MLHYFEDRTVRGGQAIDARRGKANAANTAKRWLTAIIILD